MPDETQSVVEEPQAEPQPVRRPERQPQPRAQSYLHHARYDPLFHFFLIPASAIILILMAGYMYTYPGKFSFAMLLWSVVFIVALFKMRLYALRNQDRIIRLEESLRLSMLVPEHMRARIPEFTVRQLIALRFASDAELAQLAERALNEKMSADAIKQAIKEWRADHHRI
jgi:hypothetical protein